jgi:putative phosphoesterase
MKLNPHIIRDNLFRIVVLSDTHSNLNPLIYNLINKSDYVIHAGDILDYKILENIKLTSKELYAVNGNNDDYDELNDVVGIMRGLY